MLYRVHARVFYTFLDRSNLAASKRRAERQHAEAAAQRRRAEDLEMHERQRVQTARQRPLPFTFFPSPPSLPPSPLPFTLPLPSSSFLPTVLASRAQMTTSPRQKCAVVFTPAVLTQTTSRVERPVPKGSHTADCAQNATLITGRPACTVARSTGGEALANVPRNSRLHAAATLHAANALSHATRVVTVKVV